AVQLEHAQGVAYVGRLRGDRDGRQKDVALHDVVFDPFAVDRNVAFKKMETLVRQQCSDAIGLDIHPIDLPIGGRDDLPGQMMADEAVDAEYENTCHFSCKSAVAAGVVSMCSSIRP